MAPALVLSTVNAPYREELHVQGLVDCLLDHSRAKTKPGHVSSFFREVKPALQIEFARQFNITKAQLVAAAKAFARILASPILSPRDSNWTQLFRLAITDPYKSVAEAAIERSREILRAV